MSSILSSLRFGYLVQFDTVGSRRNRDIFFGDVTTKAGSCDGVVGINVSWRLGFGKFWATVLDSEINRDKISQCTQFKFSFKTPIFLIRKFPLLPTPPNKNKFQRVFCDFKATETIGLNMCPTQVRNYCPSGFTHVPFISWVNKETFLDTG